MGYTLAYLCLFRRDRRRVRAGVVWVPRNNPVRRWNGLSSDIPRSRLAKRRRRLVLLRFNLLLSGLRAPKNIPSYGGQGRQSRFP